MQETTIEVKYDELFKMEQIVINKLVGVIGEEFIKLYPIPNSNEISTTMNAPHIGIGFAIRKTFSALYISSMIKQFPIYKGDTLSLYLDNSSIIRLACQTGGFKYNMDRRGYLGVSDDQLAALATNNLQRLELTNIKTSSLINCDFANNIPNYQYNDENGGQNLLRQVVAEIVEKKKHLQ